ncbi:MAG TPA: hypothetical protein VK629_00390 [Steroidobacteraceae bacterium]|nr:hypothetical protein [Steroidobacteraceae bacterium]
MKFAQCSITACLFASIVLISPVTTTAQSASPSASDEAKKTGSDSQLQEKLRQKEAELEAKQKERQAIVARLKQQEAKLGQSAVDAELAAAKAELADTNSKITQKQADLADTRAKLNARGVKTKGGGAAGVETAGAGAVADSEIVTKCEQGYRDKAVAGNYLDRYNAENDRKWCRCVNANIDGVLTEPERSLYSANPATFISKEQFGNEKNWRLFQPIQQCVNR